MPIVQVTVPPPVVAALKPGPGNQASTGASDVRGPGPVPAAWAMAPAAAAPGMATAMAAAERRRAGFAVASRDSDYPAAAKEALISGTVAVRYVVAVSGRVTECSVTGSSGNAELDQTTCRLIKERFRFKPSKG